MSINMSTSTEGGQTMTVTASDEDAMKLAELLKMAGIGSGDAGGGCNSCGESPCGCDHVDENAPDWPTNKEYNSDALQYAGGLNKPKETGQTTAPVFSRDARRQHTPESEELTRIREIAGLKEAAGPDEDLARKIAAIARSLKPRRIFEPIAEYFDDSLDDGLSAWNDMGYNEWTMDLAGTVSERLGVDLFELWKEMKSGNNGLDEGAKPDFLDMDKDGDKKEPMKKAVKDKDEEKKVEESIFALTNQWRAFKG